MAQDRINLAYLTSCREVGNDELIGREVIDPVTGVSYGYRMGNLESMVNLLLDRESDFARTFNLVAVVIDDDEEQEERAWREADLWPRYLKVPISRNGFPYDPHPTEQTLGAMTIQIPSLPWRSLRRESGELSELFRDRKSIAKAVYECRIINALRRHNVDLIISDSYVTIIGETLLSAYQGRILNIHPAITRVGDPDRLPGLTPTRDAYTRAVHGYVIIDDKHAVDIPTGEPLDVVYDGRTRRAVFTGKNSRTGVTVHVVTEEVDNGPVVLDERYAFETEGITPERIRNMNYEIKRRILPKALLQYIPCLDVQRRIQQGRIQNRIYNEVRLCNYAVY